MTAPNFLQLSAGSPASGSRPTGTFSSSVKRSGPTLGDADLGDAEESFAQLLGDLTAAANTSQPEEVPPASLEGASKLVSDATGLVAETTANAELESFTVTSQPLVPLAGQPNAAPTGLSAAPQQPTSLPNTLSAKPELTELPQTTPDSASPETPSIQPGTPQAQLSQSTATTSLHLERARPGTPDTTTASSAASSAEEAAADSSTAIVADPATDVLTGGSTSVPEIVATPLAERPTAPVEHADAATLALTSANQDLVTERPRQGAGSTPLPTAPAPQDAIAQSAAVAANTTANLRPRNSATTEGVSEETPSVDTGFDQNQLSSPDTSSHLENATQTPTGGPRATDSTDQWVAPGSGTQPTLVDVSSPTSLALETETQPIEPPAVAGAEITAMESSPPLATQSPAAPTAATSDAPAPISTADLTTAAIADQLVSEVRTTLQSDQRSVSSIEMMLDPPELGRVTIRIEQSAQGLIANITATEDSAFQLLSQDTQQLMQSLEDAGLEFTDFQLSHQSAEDRRHEGSALDHEERPLIRDELPTDDATSPRSGNSLVNVLA